MLIEIQQSQKALDILRFRTYLGKQYIHRSLDIKDNECVEDVNALPIVTIYMLGFKLPANPYIAVKIDRAGKNIIDGGNVEIEEPLMENLTHDAYFIQVLRLKDEMFKKWDECSELVKLLSLFEQKYFVDGKYIKKYPHTINPKTDKILVKMIKSLERIAADPDTRRIMEEQEFDELEMNLLSNTITKQSNTITRQGNTITEQGNTIASLQSNNAFLQSNNAFLQSNNASLQSNNASLQSQLDAYIRMYGNMN